VIVILKRPTEENIRLVCRKLEQYGYGSNVSQGEEKTIIGAIGTRPEHRALLMEQFAGLPFVERVVPVLKPYKLVSSESRDGRSVVKVGSVSFGGSEVVLCAGPCAVESFEQLSAVAGSVKASGAKVLRGGAFKPRSSPYDFQGLGEKALEMLSELGRQLDLPVATEVRSARQVEIVAEHADVLQIGARNMQNFDLLREAGHSGKPVLLKRGFSATIEEWMKAAEYVASTGNMNVLLCERGVRTFEPQERFTLDVTAVLLARQHSHLPVGVDPSHPAGRRDLVPGLALAGVAAGADFLLVEVHNDPDSALCDGPQALLPDQFAELACQVRSVAKALGRQ